MPGVGGRFWFLLYYVQYIIYQVLVLYNSSIVAAACRVSASKVLLLLCTANALSDALNALIPGIYRCCTYTYQYTTSQDGPVVKPLGTYYINLTGQAGFENLKISPGPGSEI